MLKNYSIPMQLFIIFEKCAVNIWNSKKLNYNNLFLLVSPKWFLSFIYVCKKELFLNNSTLIEHSAIDLKSQKNLNFNLFLNKKFNKIIFYNFYFYSIKFRINFFILFNTFRSNAIDSIDKFYHSANWLEREMSEMYGIILYNKNDVRKLLLEYSKFENPLLKDFSSDGVKDIFYNFFENQVAVVQNEIVEL